MQTDVRFGTRSLLSIAAMASFLSVAPFSSAFAAEDPDKAVDQAEVQARQVWRDTMHDLSAPESGCFHASFPSTQWEKVECAAPPAYRSALPTAKGSKQTAGNGADYVAQAPKGHFFTSVKGSFPKTSGVKSEKGAGVSLFGDGGVLGPNEYSLQVNTDFHYSAACDGYSYCQAWQQYVLATNGTSLTSDKTTGNSVVFIEYWLLNYGVDEGGRNICPKGFIDYGIDGDGAGPGDDCVQNTRAAVVHSGQIPISKLADLELSGSAKRGGTDEATAIYGADAYKASVHDSFTDIASVWSDAEFNVVGNAGGSRADFNSGVALLVKVALSYGSTSAPKCQPPSKELGTTGETNNLSLGTCSAEGGSKPEIEFVESN
jgi:hypothetical protein